MLPQYYCLCESFTTRFTEKFLWIRVIHHVSEDISVISVLSAADLAAQRFFSSVHRHVALKVKRVLIRQAAHVTEVLLSLHPSLWSVRVSQAQLRVMRVFVIEHIFVIVEGSWANSTAYQQLIVYARMPPERRLQKYLLTISAGDMRTHVFCHILFIHISTTAIWAGVRLQSSVSPNVTFELKLCPEGFPTVRASETLARLAVLC